MTEPPQIEFPGIAPTALYRLYDADGGLLYIGITANLSKRMREHRLENGRWWGFVARKMVAFYPTREDAKRAEAAAILAEKPRHNSVHARDANGKRPPWYVPPWFGEMP